VTLKVREAASGQSFNFNAPASGLEDRTASFNEFDSSELLNDLMFSRDDDNLGVQVQGLDPGQYEVFVIAREQDQADRTYAIDIGSSTSSSVAVGDFGPVHATDTPTSAPSEWVLNQNYYSEVITVEPGESVYVLVDVTSTAKPFGLFQGLQLVQLATLKAADFNSDGAVDNLDLIKWQSEFGVNNGADADDDGDSDGYDFLAWQRACEGSVSNLTTPMSTSAEDKASLAFLEASELEAEQQANLRASAIDLYRDLAAAWFSLSRTSSKLESKEVIFLGRSQHSSDSDRSASTLHRSVSSRQQVDWKSPQTYPHSIETADEGFSETKNWRSIGETVTELLSPHLLSL